MSFDGFGWSCPPEVTHCEWASKDIGFHTDQSYCKSNFECLQSWVTAYDVNRGDATLGFLEKSNNYHKEFSEKFKITNLSDWYKLNPKQIEWYISKGCEFVKIICKRGSMVFWDSRTIHSSVGVERERSHQNFRAVIYLCYMPRAMITEKNLIKKKTKFTNQITCSHNPCIIKPFSTKPRIYPGQVLPVVEKN